MQPVVGQHGLVPTFQPTDQLVEPEPVQIVAPDLHQLCGVDDPQSPGTPAGASSGGARRQDDPQLRGRPGRLNAQRGFPRIKGCKQMHALVAAPRAYTAAVTAACKAEKAA